jgi:hypothetical protein
MQSENNDKTLEHLTFFPEKKAQDRSISSQMRTTITANATTDVAMTLITALPSAGETMVSSISSPSKFSSLRAAGALGSMQRYCGHGGSKHILTSLMQMSPLARHSVTPLHCAAHRLRVHAVALPSLQVHELHVSVGVGLSTSEPETHVVVGSALLHDVLQLARTHCDCRSAIRPPRNHVALLRNWRETLVLGLETRARVRIGCARRTNGALGRQLEIAAGDSAARRWTVGTRALSDDLGKERLPKAAG